MKGGEKGRYEVVMYVYMILCSVSLPEQHQQMDKVMLQVKVRAQRLGGKVESLIPSTVYVTYLKAQSVRFGNIQR